MPRHGHRKKKKNNNNNNHDDGSKVPDSLLPLHPLSCQEIHDKFKVKDAYRDFWNNIKFRKGWDHPAIQLEEVNDCLDEAAEIVVRIRSALDKLNPQFKIRMIDGSAREFLWTKHEIGDREAFISDIVHQTFKDANGYVEDLTEELINKYIKEVKAYNQENFAKVKEFSEHLNTEWKQTRFLMKKLLTTNQLQEVFQTHPNQIESLFKQLNSLNKQLDELTHTQVNKMDISTDINNTNTSNSSNNSTNQDNVETSTTTPTTTPTPTINTPKVEELEDDQQNDKEQSIIEETPVKKEELQTTLETSNLQESTTQNENNKETKEETKEEKEKEKEKETTSNNTITPSKEEDHHTEEKLEKDNNSTQNEKSQTISETKDVEMSEPQQSQQDKQEMEVEKQVEQSQQDKQEEEEEEEKEKQEKELEEKQSSEDTSSETESEKEEEQKLLKIEILAKDVDTLKHEIKSLEDTTKSLTLEKTDPSEAKEYVQQLQKKCTLYTETLMKDLLILDSLVGEKIRPIRKQQVQSIQELMTHLDKVNEGLRGLLQQVQKEEEKKKKEEAELEAELLKQKKKELEAKEEERKRLLQQQHEEKHRQEAPTTKTSPPPPSSSQSIWRSLKLKPKMEVSETNKEFIITSNIPGMKEEDISLRVDPKDRTLTIEGIREPSHQEETELRRQIRHRLQTDPLYALYGADERQLLLRSGSGRYGKFSETYQLPQTANEDEISASYSRGILKVTIPKKYEPRLPQASMFPGSRRHAPMGFFNDSDFWW